MWDILDGPVVKISLSNAWVAGSIPGWGAKIPFHMLHSRKNQNKTIL